MSIFSFFRKGKKGSTAPGNGGTSLITQDKDVSWYLNSIHNKKVDDSRKTYNEGMAEINGTGGNIYEKYKKMSFWRRHFSKDPEDIETIRRHKLNLKRYSNKEFADSQRELQKRIFNNHNNRFNYETDKSKEFIDKYGLTANEIIDFGKTHIDPTLDAASVDDENAKLAKYFQLSKLTQVAGDKIHKTVKDPEQLKKMIAEIKAFEDEVSENSQSIDHGLSTYDANKKEIVKA